MRRRQTFCKAIVKYSAYLHVGKIPIMQFKNLAKLAEHLGNMTGWQFNSIKKGPENLWPFFGPFFVTMGLKRYRPGSFSEFMHMLVAN